MIDVRAATRSLQIRRVLLLGSGKVQPVMARVVKEVALDPPNFVVHLIPLGARVGINLHRIEVQGAFSGLGSRRRRRDKPGSTVSRTLAVKRLLAVGGNRKR